MQTACMLFGIACTVGSILFDSKGQEMWSTRLMFVGNIWLATSVIIGVLS